MSIKVIDNFLDKNILKSLKENFLNNEFPWFYEKGKVFNTDNTFQFGHLFFNNNHSNSHYVNLLNPVFEKLKLKSLVRCKLNLTTKEKTIFKYGFHTDVNFDDENCKTAILYLNTNNGKTVFEKESISDIASIENRILIFPSNYKHSGTSTTNKQYRMVLNINYF